MRKITAIMGDGIGPEVMEAAMRVVDATGVKVEWEKVYAGRTALEKSGNPLPAETIDSIRRNRVALKGPCETPTAGGYRSVNVSLRKQFKLYTNIRPVESIVGVKSRFSNVDLVVFREGIEGIYAADDYYMDRNGNLSHEPTDIAKVVGTITAENSRKFFTKAFDYALSHKRKKVTIVHKANIMKATEGLFLNTGLRVAKSYPSIKVDTMIVDATSMKLVLDPTQFDVLAMTNMFGDILSDQCAGLVGGLGFVPGANMGDEYAIFEAAHGTAGDIAGKNMANPTALILSAAMMLDYIGGSCAAERIRKAVRWTIAEGKHVTIDINPSSSFGTTDMTEMIVYALRRIYDF